MNDWYNAIRSAVFRELDASPYLDDEQLKQLIDKTIFALTGSEYISTKERIELATRLFDSFRGLDALQPLIDNADITEVMINGGSHIFIERMGKVERADAVIESEERLNDLVQMIVGKVNRAVNESQPIVDARLADGSRVHVVLPPISLNGPTVTIRKFPSEPFTLDELVKSELMTEEAANQLQVLVAAKFNLFIAGGTGSGKTTLLNALAQYIRADERVITIEDSAELKIRGVANLVGLETRNANSEGKGQVTMRDLIRASLRMRPDRLVVAEVRGAEAFDMLQAMNTGHDGSLCTGHANSARDMLYRLETMVLGGIDLPIEAIRRHICSAIDVVIHISKYRDGIRRVGEICELGDIVDGEIVLNPLYTLEKVDDREQPIRLRRTEKPLIRVDKLEKAGIAL